MMKCPVCTQVDLLLAERQGVEIDYCPTCRGVWLDRGELDKIIERADSRSVAEPGRAYQRPPEPPGYQQHQQQAFHHDQRGSGIGQGGYYKKKKSLLSEIFDFD